MELKPTTKVAEALAVAQRAAQTSGHAEITPAHLALALAEQEGTTTPALLAAAGTSAAGRRRDRPRGARRDAAQHRRERRDPRVSARPRSRCSSTPPRS